MYMELYEYSTIFELSSFHGYIVSVFLFRQGGKRRKPTKRHSKKRRKGKRKINSTHYGMSKDLKWTDVAASDFVHSVNMCNEYYCLWKNWILWKHCQSSLSIHFWIDLTTRIPAEAVVPGIGAWLSMEACRDLLSERLLSGVSVWCICFWSYSFKCHIWLCTLISA